MLLDIISLFTGFLFLFVILLMLINPIKGNKRNIYFILILFISGYHRFFNGFNSLSILHLDFTLLNNKPVIVFYIVPIYYLFFYRIMIMDFVIRKELLHFIFPTALLIINYWYINFKLYSILYLFYSIIYLIMLFVKVKTFFYTKNQTILGKMNKKVIKTWLILMLVITVLNLVYSLFLSFSDVSNQNITRDYLKYSSLLWFLPFFYIFSNPVILFGEEYLLKNLKKLNYKDHLIWRKKPLKIIDENDKKLYENIFDKISMIILGIQSLQKSIPVVSKKTLTAKIIAEELNIPKKHVTFIFKYYCHYSVNDFSNLIKINYALTLINEGYLKEYTIESLGEKCLFKSRFTFSQNFKKFVGTSVSEYGNAISLKASKAGQVVID